MRSSTTTTVSVSRPVVPLTRTAVAAALTTAVLLGAGCSFTPTVERPRASAEMPKSFEREPSDSAAIGTHWWRAFGDPVLETLVDSALARNRDLAEAAARVAEVQSRYRITRASLLPSVTVAVDGTTQEVPTNTGATRRISETVPQFPDRFEFTTYSASLGLQYEIDFWGRVRANRSAALSTFFASREDLRTVRVGIIAETISTYFEIVELSRQIELSRSNVDLLSERAELTQSRYERGLVSSFELYTIEQEYEDARAAQPLLESRIVDAEGRLAVLLGTYRGDIADSVRHAAREITADLGSVPPGLPSELLRNRPDVAAAAHRLEAARQRIGVARAEQFPRFSLTGSGGTQSSTLDDLVDTGQRFWLFGGSLTAPIFNAGALRANVDVAWAQYEQQAAAYERAVLTAFKDVESALIALHKERERYDFLLQALERADSSAETQESRYMRGIGDYLAYVDARRNLIRVQSTVASAERSLAGARLALHRSLGGEWIDETPQ